MKLRDFYESNGVDYDAFLRRLMGKESLADKYIKIFLADSTYSELAEAVAAADIDLVGNKAHTLKGIALNLDLEKLSVLCIDMVNSSREGNAAAMKTQFARLEAEYQRIVTALQS